MPSIIGLPGQSLRDELWERYLALLSEASSDQILVLVESSTRSNWNERLKTLSTPTQGHRVVTPIAWIQQELTLWWPLVESGLIEHGFSPTGEPPLFVAIDIAQYLMGIFTQEPRETGLLADAKMPPHFQNGQILDAFARGVESGIASWQDTKVIPQRLREGAPESNYAKEVEEALQCYIKGTLPRHILDHALTLDLFEKILWPHPLYQKAFLQHTHHLLVENLDETTPLLQKIFCKMEALGVETTFTLQRDPEGDFQGGLREYIGADPFGAHSCIEDPQIIPNTPPLLELGRGLHQGIRGDLQTISIPEEHLSLELGHLSYASMLDSVEKTLRTLLQQVPPNAIALVVPALDPLIIWSLRSRLERLGTTLYVFAGTNRLSDYRPVRMLITLAKLCHPEWKLPSGRFELLELLETVTGLNPLRLSRYLVGESLEGELPGSAKQHYEHLKAWIETQRETHQPDLGRFFQEGFAEILATHLPAYDEEAQRQVSQIGQLIELASRFRAVDERIHEGEWGNRFLEFLRENPIAERPFFNREPHRDSVMLSTASQLAEKGFLGPEESLKHLLLLDIGSERWWKSDKRELTNARVLSHRWKGGAYTPEDDEKDQNEKLARVMMACCLKVTEKLWIYGSLCDSEGYENRGDLPYLLESILGRTLCS